MFAPFQFINTGSAPNDGTGDSLRSGSSKINSNFSIVSSSLYELSSSLELKLNKQNLKSGYGILIDSSSNDMNISFQSPYINTGSGYEIFVTESNVFKKIQSGQNISITDNGSTIEISASSYTRSKTLLQWTPLDNQPPSSSFSTIDTRNSVIVLDFDQSTDESSIFVGFIPESSDISNGIVTRLVWTATVATSGSVRWAASFENGNSNIDTDSFSTEKSIDSTTNVISGIPTISSITFSSSEIDNISEGSFFRLKIKRVASNVLDTMSGDAELLSVEIREA